MSDYPDTAELAAIASFSPGEKWSGSEPWLPILQLCCDAWNHDMGVVRVTDDGKQWTFITGGWSGNEEILEELDRHQTARHMLWLESHRGGKYVYGVRE